MLQGITVILTFLLLGEVLVETTQSPVPGPVAGMLLLWIGLAIKGSASASLRRTSEGLLNHLSLLFVPAGTGLFFLPQELLNDWPGILAAMVMGTFITMVLCSLIARYFAQSRISDD